jgi:hypothetical protein
LWIVKLLFAGAGRNLRRNHSRYDCPVHGFIASFHSGWSALLQKLKAFALKLKRHLPVHALVIRECLLQGLINLAAIF